MTNRKDEMQNASLFDVRSSIADVLRPAPLFRLSLAITVAGLWTLVLLNSVSAAEPAKTPAQITSPWQQKDPCGRPKFSHCRPEPRYCKPEPVCAGKLCRPCPRYCRPESVCKYPICRPEPWLCKPEPVCCDPEPRCCAQPRSIHGKLPTKVLVNIPPRPRRITVFTASRYGSD